MKMFYKNVASKIQLYWCSYSKLVSYQNLLCHVHLIEAAFLGLIVENIAY